MPPEDNFLLKALEGFIIILFCTMHTGVIKLSLIHGSPHEDRLGQYHLEGKVVGGSHVGSSLVACSNKNHDRMNRRFLGGAHESPLTHRSATFRPHKQHRVHRRQSSCKAAEHAKGDIKQIYKEPPLNSANRSEKCSLG